MTARTEEQTAAMTKPMAIKSSAALALPPLERLIPLTLQIPKAILKIRAKTVASLARFTGSRGGRTGVGVLICSS
jgi:hypothetical protein